MKNVRLDRLDTLGYARIWWDMVGYGDVNYWIRATCTSLTIFLTYNAYKLHDLCSFKLEKTTGELCFFFSNVLREYSVSCCCAGRMK